MNTTPLQKCHILEKSQFPPLLRQIPDPPNTLYVCSKSDIHSIIQDRKILCVVGSRKYSDYGKEMCQTFIKSLTGLPVVIVSGLALGIDGIAHQAALDNNIPTIAIPGSGLHKDILYPRSHFSLAENIIEHGGALLSEYPPQTRASPWSFPMRNRIMAGCSHAVLVIEAEADSGTLITARLALEYNRDVGALPGSVLSSNSRGTNNLIKSGAAAITDSNDLLELLGFPLPNENTSIPFPRPNPYSDCSPEEIAIANLLFQPRSKDEIIKMSALPVNKVQIILSMLEIRGIIVETYGLVALRFPPPYLVKQ